MGFPPKKRCKEFFIMATCTYISRISTDGREQTTASHLMETAALAKQYGAKFGVGSLAQAAAFFHDLGKFSRAFVEYLKCCIGAKGDDSSPPRGSVIHATQGAKYIAELFSGKAAIYSAAAEIVANSIAGHHGGLTDGISSSGDTPLRDRLASDRDALHYAEVLENFQNANLPAGDVDVLFSACIAELGAFSQQCKSENLDAAFMLHLLVKSIFSCLVDADRYNAYCFEARIEQEAQNRIPPWDVYAARLEEGLSLFKIDSDIADIRHDISKKCLNAAKRARGIYRLNVPTGGGKTLSSLRFALNHAQEHKLERVIYVIPYLSVLEQTASEVRKALSYSVADDFVLEHHSNLLPPDDENDAQARRLLTSRWSRPIIITTMVQFLESIFSHKSSDLRKLHNMANSVFIFDEVQSLPVKCVHLFNGVLNYLRVFGGCTTLLCTATQPLLDKVERPVRLSTPPELISDMSEAFAKLKRTRIVDSTILGGYSYKALRDFAMEKLSSAGNCLVILNTKKDAAKLYASAKTYIAENPDCKIKLVHLSTSMCPAHRSAVIDSLQTQVDGKKQLKDERILCISTQLIEAGVDISFRCVIRALAGLDSIAQAAGRGNRNGEDPNGCEVCIVNLTEENLSQLPDIEHGKNVTARILDESPHDILSPEIMARYYDEYFYKRRDNMDYTIENNITLYDLLSCNRKGCESYVNSGGKTLPALRQAFQTAGENFCVLEQGTTGVLVPYGRGEQLAEEYKTANLRDKPNLLREMGRYSVSLFARQFGKLKHAICPVGDDVYTLRKDCYDPECGVMLY
jgi:CRISPR-associated endonuclease/helicase Cas3